MNGEFFAGGIEASMLRASGRKNSTFRFCNNFFELVLSGVKFGQSIFLLESRD